MNFYDEQIKQIDREIKKLNADIDKKKAHVAELQQARKKYETEKRRDIAYSDLFMQVLMDGNIKTDEQRGDILQHIKEYIADMKSSKSAVPVLEDFEETAETENHDMAEIEEPMQMINYQNPLYTNNQL